MTTSTTIVRATGLLVIEVRDSNPNGDPDQEGEPRRRSHDQRGMISPVSFKRKIRDLIQAKDGPVWQALEVPEAAGKFEILESRGRDRKEIGTYVKNKSFAGRYWDARVFGATFLEEKQETYIRAGAVQLGLGVSVAPVRVERMTNTNISGVQEGKDRGMAPLGYRVVVHGVYCIPFFVNPSSAQKSACTPEDLDLFLKLVPLAYANSASASRACIEVRHAWYAEHRSPLGSFSDFAFMDMLTPVRKGADSEQPSTCWTDYEVPVGLGDLAEKAQAFRDLVNP